MNDMQDTPIVNNLERKVGEESSSWIRSLPKELVGLIPESVWSTLSLDQKKEILRQNGLFEKYNSAPVAEVPVAETAPVEPVALTEVVSEAPIVETQITSTKESQEFATLVEGFKNVEKQSVEEKREDAVVLTQEEKARVDQETAKSANTQTFKLFGYQVDDATAQNSKDISDNGSLEDGRTWAATLLKKLFAIFGE